MIRVVPYGDFLAPGRICSHESRCADCICRAAYGLNSLAENTYNDIDHYPYHSLLHALTIWMDQNTAKSERN